MELISSENEVTEDGLYAYKIDGVLHVLMRLPGGSWAWMVPIDEWMSSKTELRERTRVDAVKKALTDGRKVYGFTEAVDIPDCPEGKI